MKTNIINQILTEGYASQVKALSFQPGQIVTGKIIKLFPDNMAALQIGTQKIVAQLEAPLEAGKSYWFQVLPGEGKPRLKVLVNAADNKQDNAHAALLKQLSLPLTKENQSFISFLLKEQLPVKKEIFQLASEWHKGSAVTSSETEAIKLLLQKGLPLTKSSFQAVLSALNNESFSQLLDTLSSLLQQPNTTVGGEKLLSFLQKMYRQVSAGLDIPSGQNPSERSKVVQYLKEITQQMGLSYEEDLVQFLKHPQEGQDIKRESLKPLLIDFLQENPAGTLRETAEKILNKITGIQLLGQELGPIQQIALQLPIMLGQKAVDLTMQWSGKKQANGQIDPAYCRILFYVELQYLKETIVDMQVQNRVIRLQVINEHEHLTLLAAPFIDGLKKNLQTLNFTLSAVHFTRPTETESKYSTKHHAPALFDQGHYSGVDIRI